MKFFKRRTDLGPRMLGAWLIGFGAMSLTPLPIPFLAPLLALLAIATGVVILLER